MIQEYIPAFSLPLDVFSSLRVNLLGREPHGRIRTGEEYRRYLDAFAAELSQLVNVDTGETAVERVFRADEQHDPFTIGSCPDLIVWWRKTAPIRTIRSVTLGTISGEFTDIRSGEHVMRGMLLMSHPQAKPGHHVIAGMKGLDIPATLCELVGVRPGIRLDGTSRVRDLMAGSSSWLSPAHASSSSGLDS
jgi:predicted AlkP superfamily phosphohydrolase/phosphomutase